MLLCKSWESVAVRTYGKIYLSDDRKHWKINNAEPHICIKLKAIFSKIGKANTQPFNFINNNENCHDLLWFMERYPLSISDENLFALKKGKKKHIDNINELESILLPDYSPQIVKLKEPYVARNYQLTGCEIYLKCKRILIGDDIGLGKSLIGIISCLEKVTRPCVVTVQTHLPKQWKDAIEQFTDLKVHIMKGTKPYDLPPADIYITKYSCLAGWSNVFETGIFKSCVFDEVQELRHNGTAKYDGAKALSNNVDYCCGLSATPIYNYGDEIFNVLNVIKEGCLGHRDDFLREWTNYGKIVKEPQALGTYLREQMLLLRRTRKEVGRELPPINKIVHTIGYDENEVKKADELAKILSIKVTSGSFMERGQASRELDILVRHATGVSKARNVAEYVKILLENGEPIVLAAWHRDVYDILLEELKEYKPVMFTGSESPAQKEKAKQAFINGETNLFIISLGSGIGLDGLQKRSCIIVIAELAWSPKIHDQLIGRLHRDFQENQVTAIFLVSDYGSDPLIIDMLGIKSSQSHNIINPLQAVEEQYTDESRIKLLAQRFLEKKNIEKVA
jgi:SNF2 family DNA or RNA helicase